MQKRKEGDPKQQRRKKKRKKGLRASLHKIRKRQEKALPLPEQRREGL